MCLCDGYTRAIGTSSLSNLDVYKYSHYRYLVTSSPQALSCSEWADGDPTEAEQDFWDGAQLNVCILSSHTVHHSNIARMSGVMCFVCI